MTSYAVIQAFQEHIERHSDILSDASIVLLLSDGAGWLLEWIGHEKDLAALAHLGITPGCSVQEQHLGNLAIGSALHEQQSVVRHGTEHFLYATQRWSSAATPLIHPTNGNLLGVVCIMAMRPHAHPLNAMMSHLLATSIVHLVAEREHSEYHRLLHQSLSERSSTLQRSLEQQVADAERQYAVTSLAAGIAHEIRNPLTTTRGFLQLFRAKTESDRDKQFLQLTIEEIDRVTKLLHDFMSLTKPDNTAHEWVHLSELIRMVGQLIATEAALLGVPFTMHVADDLTMWGNASQLKQVILNVLQNALQASASSHAEVTLRLETRDESIVILVEDQGSGMTPVQLERIFEPFYTTKQTGTGMGMAVSKRIVDEHEGAIHVASSVGEGTLVTIHFPTSPTASHAAAGKDGESSSSSVS